MTTGAQCGRTFDKRVTHRAERFCGHQCRALWQEAEANSGEGIDVEGWLKARRSGEMRCETELAAEEKAIRSWMEERRGILVGEDGE